MTDTKESNSLLQEIEEEMHRQKLEAFWKSYGPTIIGMAFAIVLGTAAHAGWHAYKVQTEQKATTELLTILQKDEEPQKQMDDLALFAKQNGEDSQATFARLHEAAIAADRGDAKTALEIYDALAADKAQNDYYRGLASLMAVQIQMDTGDAAKLIERLKPLMADDSAWKYMSREYAGYLALKLGDKEQAKTYFQELHALSDTPPAIAKRANDMLEWINGGA